MSVARAAVAVGSTIFTFTNVGSRAKKETHGPECGRVESDMLTFMNHLKLPDEKIEVIFNPFALY